MTISSQDQVRYQPQGGKWRIGKDIRTGEYIDAPQGGRREGLYIIGLPGTGKTGLIENLIIQDIKQGMGVGLLDPHGDLTQAVLARIPDRREQDVIYLDITDEDNPFGLNLFTCDDPTSAKTVQVVVDNVMHVFDKLFGLSAATTPRLRQYLRNCTQTLIVNPGYTMADMPLLLLDEHCRKKLIANVINTQVQSFWKTFNRMKPSEQLDHADSTLNKLDELLQPLTVNIVGQSTSSVDVRTIMVEGKILLVKLSAQLDSITSLIGSVLIALFLNAAYARPANKRRQFNLYADEFQRFATDDFATLLTEARKFGIATTVAHQARYQPGMTDGIRATSLGAKNLVVFKVTSKDADELAGEFDITPQEAWEEVLEEERFEQKIDVIEEEVEEDIEEITQNPVAYLTSARGTHGNVRVREAMRLLLDNFNNKSDTVATMLDKLLVGAMEGSVILGTEKFVEKIHVIANPIFFSAWFDFKDNVPNEYAQCNEMLLRFIEAIIKNGHATDDNKKDLLEADLEILLAQRIYDANVERRMHSGYHQLPDKEIAFLRKYWFLESNRQVEVSKQKMEKLQVILQAVISLCEGLAADPIRVPTGQKRLVPKKRTHLSYLTHPRKTILHPQRTYADVHNEVASQLVNLDNFMARVRYINADQRNVECTIRTLDPKQDADTRPLFGSALEDRIARIKARNMQDGYLRERMEIEAEIRQRQELCCEPPNEPSDAIYRRPQR